jgi:hypothetical protein
MYQIQMRALNALRADFTNKLKLLMVDPANTASEDAVRQAVRNLWRDIIFQLISTIVTEGWVKTAEALIQVAIQNTLDFFFTKVWYVYTPQPTLFLAPASFFVLSSDLALALCVACAQARGGGADQGSGQYDAGSAGSVGCGGSGPDRGRENHHQRMHCGLH